MYSFDCKLFNISCSSNTVITCMYSYILMYIQTVFIVFIHVVSSTDKCCTFMFMDRILSQVLIKH